MTPAFSATAPFIELQQVESTNNYATGLVHAGMAQNGTAVFAHHQTAGKGQRGRQWAGEAGMNIAMSFILQPPALSLSQSFLLSMSTALATQQFFSAHAGADVKIKWPNDIYWQDRKAAGILIENVLQGTEWKAAIVGTGININQTAFGELNKAVSLKQISGSHHDPLLLAKDLHRFLLAACEQMRCEPAKMTEQYKAGLYKLNCPVRFKKGSRVFEATVKDVTSLGELVVQHAVEERFAVGEVEWLIE